jgi:predicted dehydrogenase/threonine dehydrogenase-like Zn-dependent dehydrogenase
LHGPKEWIDLLLDGTQGRPMEVERAAGHQGHRQSLATSGAVVGHAVRWPSLGQAVFEAITVTPGPGDLLVEVNASIISSGTERARFLGLPNARIDFPHDPGYAASGLVVAVGESATGFQPGDKVALLDVPHRSIAAVPPERAQLVPPGVPLADAAIAQLALVAGLGVRRANLQADEPYGVVGMGLIGALTQRLARTRGAGPCSAMAWSRTKEAVAIRGGAPRLLAVDQDLAEIEQLELPVVIEASGDPQALAVAVAAAAPKGRIVLLGSPRGRAALNLIERARRKRLQLIGAHVTGLDRSSKVSMIDTILRALSTGSLQVVDLLVEADPREAARIYRRLVADRQLVGVRFDWTTISDAPSGGLRASARHGSGPPSLAGLAISSRPTASSEADGGRNVGRSATAGPTTGRRAAERPFGFGFVGCGEIALLNADAIALAPNASMTACYDIKPELARDLARRHSAAVAPSLPAMLERKDVDAVVLALPHSLHEPIAIQALSAGKHVVVEKPIAIDLKGALRMVRAAKQAGVALSVCFPDRYGDEVETARQIIRQEGLGDVFMVELLWYADKPLSYLFGGFSGRAQSTWRMWAEASGGGVLSMNLCHGLDLIHHVTGLGVDYASASVATFARLGNVEDTCVLNIAFENGALGVLAGSSVARALRHETLRVLGTDGRLELRPTAEVHTSRLLRGLDLGANRRVPLGGPTSPVVSRSRYFGSFAYAVRDGRGPDVTGEDGLQVQATIAAAYEAARSGARTRPGDLMQTAQAELASKVPSPKVGTGAPPGELREPEEVITNPFAPAR